MNKEYLGDGVYVYHDEWGGIWLTTENGIETTNKIYLEPSVYNHLDEYAKRLQKRMKGEL